MRLSAPLVEDVWVGIGGEKRNTGYLFYRRSAIETGRFSGARLLKFPQSFSIAHAHTNTGGFSKKDETQSVNTWTNLHWNKT